MPAYRELTSDAPREHDSRVTGSPQFASSPFDGRSLLHPVRRSHRADAAGVLAVSRPSSTCRSGRGICRRTASDAPDLSVRFHDRVAGTPVGPASGPQSQMAQNLVLSWLAGVADHGAQNRPDQRPADDRPPLHRRGQRRLQHRVVARAARPRFARSIRARRDADPHAARTRRKCSAIRSATSIFAGTAGETIYDMSIGYDLAGIQTDKGRQLHRAA